MKQCIQQKKKKMGSLIENIEKQSSPIFLVDISQYQHKIEKAFKKFMEEDGGVLSERWYHLNQQKNSVKVFYYRYQLDKNGLPISRTWETVVLTLEN